MELNPATGRLSLSTKGKTKRAIKSTRPTEPHITQSDITFHILKHTRKLWLACF